MAALAVIVLALAGPDSRTESRQMPGSAFGPDEEAIRRYTLNPIRIRRFARGACRTYDGFFQAPRTQTGPQYIDLARPAILSKVDVQLYRRGFAVLQARNRKLADRFLAATTDKRLAGPLLFERYRSRDYEPTFTELSEWLSRYSSLYGAQPIYRLARHRKPGGSAIPEKPQLRMLKSSACLARHALAL